MGPYVDAFGPTVYWGCQQPGDYAALALQRLSAMAPERPWADSPGMPGVSVRSGAAGLGRGVVRLVSRLVVGATAMVVVVLAVGIVFKDLNANAANTLVRAFERFARDLAGPFDQMFRPKNAKVGLSVNWGTGAAVYLAVGRIAYLVLRRLA